MALLDLIKHNKIKGPQFINSDKLDTRISMLDELLDKVGDDQKEIIEREKKLISVGNLGEENVIYELKHSRENMLVIHDVTIENQVRDSQIDFVLITRRGIIVLETKRLEGDIEINSEGEFTRIFKTAQGKVYKKEGIYSPITQNRYHLDAIEDLLSNGRIAKGIPMYSLVVIANPKTIVNKTYARREIKEVIVKFDQLNNAIEKLLANSEYDLSDSKMIEIGDYILENDRPRVYDYVQKLHLVLKEEKENDTVKETDIIDDESIAKEHTDDSLYEDLRKYRFKKATEFNLKPYFIFNNDQLSNLVLKKPTNKEEFLAVEGMTPKKYEAYGTDILAIIQKDSSGVQSDAPTITDEHKSENTEPIVQSGKANADADEQPTDPLYEALRKYRWKKAQSLNLKPYFVFSNNQLENLSKVKPTSKDAFLAVNGMSQEKYNQYGEDVLAIIKSETNVQSGEKEHQSMQSNNPASNNEDYTKDPRYEALRKYRWAKSQELNIKPYFIFNNEQLFLLLKENPKSQDEFVRLNGFDNSKYQQYGEDILKIING